jgi:hypothetical protein
MICVTFDDEEFRKYGPGNGSPQENRAPPEVEGRPGEGINIDHAPIIPANPV